MQKEQFIILKFNIESCNMSKESTVHQYTKGIAFDNNVSFYKQVNKIVDKYIIKSEQNLKNRHYLLNNIQNILWNEYFSNDFIDNFIWDIDKDINYSWLDIPVKDLDEQFNLKNKHFTLIICGGGIGGSVGIINGLKFFFHTNESDIHHIPHIHCKYAAEEFRVELTTLNILDKPFKNNKKTKQALSIITQNKKELINYWNQVVIKGENVKLNIFKRV